MYWNLTIKDIRIIAEFERRSVNIPRCHCAIEPEWRQVVVVSIMTRYDTIHFR
jgi:hypothetical protein